MKNTRRNKIMSAAIWLIAFTFSGLTALGQTSIPIPKLSKPVERQIKGGETHLFQFEVKAGVYARVEVEQKNIDVVVSLFAPNGKLVVEMDGKDGRLWREAVSCISEKKGLFRVEIKAYGEADVVGSYTVKLVDKRKSTLLDYKRLEAESHFSLGRSFNEEGEAKLTEAIKEYEAAFVLWNELGESEWEAITLTNLGWISQDLSKYEQAIGFHTQAVGLFQKTNDQIGEGKVLNALGNSYRILKQYEKAIEFYEKALIVRGEVGDKRGKAHSLFNIALIFQVQERYDKAINYYEQTIIFSREIKDKRGMADSLNNLGVIYQKLDQTDKAILNYQEAVAYYKETNNLKGIARNLNNLAKVYSSQQEYEKAKECYLQILAISKELKERKNEAFALHDLGFVSGELGDKKKQLDYYQQALLIYREVGNRQGESAILNTLARIAFAHKDYETSIKYFEQALIIYTETKNQEKIFDVNIGLGYASENSYNFEKAFVFYKQALAVARENKNQDWEATALMNLGDAFRKLDQPEQAIDSYQLALTIFRNNKNQTSEALTLKSITACLITLGRYTEAIGIAEQSLQIYRQLKDANGEGYSLNDLGLIYYRLDQYEKSTGYLKEALDTAIKAKDNSCAACAIANIATTYFELGKPDLALTELQRGLELTRLAKDEYLEAYLLQLNGNIYKSLTRYGEAKSFYEQSLSIYQKIKKKDGIANTLLALGSIFQELNQKNTALGFFEQALAISQKINDRELEIRVIQYLGWIYLSLKQYEKAREKYEKSLIIANEIKSKNRLSSAFDGLGKSYKGLMRFDDARKYYEKSLGIDREIKNPKGEAVELSNLGELYLEFNQYEKARSYIEQSLKIKKEIKALESYAYTLNQMMILWQKLKRPELAILVGKQVVNIYQEARGNIITFNADSQESYIKSKTETYRTLADLLIAKGRVAEAEQVLEMLKDDEFIKFLRRDDKAAKELKATIKLTPTEEEAFKRYEEIADKITRIGREFGELEKESKKFPVGKFPRQAEMDKLDLQLADARKVFNKFLQELDARFRNKETKAKDDRVAQISGTKALLDSLNQPRTVIISTIAGEDRLNLIVTTSKINRAHTVDIKAADLNKLVVEFRDAVKNPLVDPRLSGKKLYDVLFPADLQKDLAGVGADTIVWSLDGTLRYVPVSALWDGQKYLVERYSNAIITLASRDKIDKTQAARTNWTALGLGVSQKFENFDALTAVPQELCRVVNDTQKKAACLKLTNGKTGVFGGKNLSDGEFTFESFRLHLGRYPIVHIASHFSLNAGTESDSYLLLGGGQTTEERKLSISAVREKLDLKFNGTELLVLSACNTAMSSGENSSGAEIEGFGALAQEQGARTVLASLWSVADDSTRDLMTEFYEQLKQNPKTGKAEALRKSQIALLNGKYKPGEIPLWRGTAVFSLGETKQSAFKTDANAPFAHPFYWSPFVLFGNWR